MKSDLFTAANKVWQKISGGAYDDNFRFEVEVYRKLLNIFMAGEYYYYIFNVKQGIFDFMSEDVSNVLGIPPSDIDVPFFLNNIHPEDQPWFLQFEKHVQQFFATLDPHQVPNYKVRYDYRVKKKNGEYIRILQQVVTVQHGDDGAVLRTLGIHTDITHLKPYGTPLLSFIGMNGEPSYLDVKIGKEFRIGISGLTKREYEILHLVASGQSSEEIGTRFFISKQTVDTHRKNLLKKTGCINSAELIALAIKKGWI